jgi:hypothetical protein
MTNYPAAMFPVDLPGWFPRAIQLFEGEKPSIKLNSPLKMVLTHSVFAETLDHPDFVAPTNKNNLFPLIPGLT